MRSKRVYIFSPRYRNDFFIAFFLNRVQNSTCPITVLWFGSINTASLHDNVIPPLLKKGMFFPVIDLQTQSKIIFLIITLFN